MFDEDGRKIEIQEFPRNFENMSVEEIEAYIEDLKAEIARAEEERASKQSSFAAADSVFKS